jgi:hypothetical protein
MVLLQYRERRARLKERHCRDWKKWFDNSQLWEGKAGECQA